MAGEGKIKSIGISNFNIEQTQEILDMCKIKPVCNQIEINPYCRNEELVDFCLKNHIIPVAYGPFGGSRLIMGNEPEILKNEFLTNLATKYQKSVGQICLRWLIQRNIVPIPKSTNATRIKENINVFDFELSEEEMNGFKSLPVHRFFRIDG
jgi:diketogulonate reductase-like aldo/keto reductase